MSHIDLETVVYDFAAEIDRCNDRSDLLSASTRSFGLLGFDGFAISDKADRAEELLTAPLLHHWRPGAFETYVDEGWWASDYIVACSADATTAAWRGDVLTGNRAHDQFLSYCRFYGGRSGVVGTLPASAGGHRVVSATSGDVRSWQRAEVATVMTLASLIVLRERRMRVGKREYVLVRAALSSVQEDILKWAAAGKSNTDIATILGMGQRAVAYHFGEIFKKLGVASRSQAVAAFASRTTL